MYRQYDLASDWTRLTCWLDSSKLRIGTRLTLKKDPVAKRIWQVTGVGSQVFEHAPTLGWKVGGLK